MKTVKKPKGEIIMSERTLTVKGLGKISLPPDQTEINITVESKDKDYNTVTERQFEKTEEIRNALAELGLDKSRLKTSNLNVSAEYRNVQNDNGAWERKLEGYKCSHNLSLKIDFDAEKLKWVISAISSCKNAEPVFSIVFSVRDKEGTSDKLLEAAVNDAVKKAAVLSEAAGLVLGNVLSIDYNSRDIDFRSPTNMLSSVSEGADCAGRSVSDMYIEPENIYSQAEVTVVWEIVA